MQRRPYAHTKSDCTGITKKINLYYVQETFQEWKQGQASAALEGAAIWLPSNVLLEIQMTAPSTRGLKADSDEGMEQNQSRGLLITFSWAVNKNTVIGEYETRAAAQSNLLELYLSGISLLFLTQWNLQYQFLLPGRLFPCSKEPPPRHTFQNSGISSEQNLFFVLLAHLKIPRSVDELLGSVSFASSKQTLWRSKPFDRRAS